MLTDISTLKQRWGGVSEVIDKWLAQREELLAIYYHMLDIREFDGTNGKHCDLLRSFCQMLVDYVSAGYFEVYDRLIGEGKAHEDREGLQQVKALMENIDATTEVALDFNDKYLETDDLEVLPIDLEQMEQTLVKRFAAEDRMIEVLHLAHIGENP